MKKICQKTGVSFEITPAELDFLEKISPVFLGKKYHIPEPTLCPEERQRRRFAFRNERKLYHRKCDATGKQIISLYQPDIPFPVYSPDAWFGDSWDAKAYGRDFDFNRPFFEQFQKLRDTVPHLSLILSNNENCDFCNFVGNSRNCYLIFGSINCQDCYYGSPYDCKDACDSLTLRDSELCIECVDSKNLYDCFLCQNCTNSQSLRICYAVDNSSDCLACVGRSRAKYCILNKQHTKEQYEKIQREIEEEGYPAMQRWYEKFQALKLAMPHRAYIGTKNENVAGDYIWNSKNCSHVFNAAKCQDVRYGSQLMDAKDGMDIDFGEYGELLYELMGFYNHASRIVCSYANWDNVNQLFYCGFCTQSSECFGCVGMKRARNCILNKQYSKEEYEALVPRIIEHMRKTGEWGQFFPAQISPFAYNETLAQEYFPLTKEEALKKGLKWLDDDTSKLYRGPKIVIPDRIEEASDDICKAILTCEETGKPYKIIPQELELYRKLRVPLPRMCPDVRHLKRLAKRNPRKLYHRTCAKTGMPIQTTYAPERPEIVYSEEVYVKEMY